MGYQVPVNESCEIIRVTVVGILDLAAIKISQSETPPFLIVRLLPPVPVETQLLRTKVRSNQE